MTHALSRMRLCSASASASAALWLLSEFRSSLRKSGKALVGLESGRLARGYRDERAAGDEPGMVRRSIIVIDCYLGIKLGCSCASKVRRLEMGAGLFSMACGGLTRLDVG